MARKARTTPTGGTALAVKAKYDAAGQGRRLAGWQAPSTGPNKAITGLQTIRNRSRDAGRNEWAGASTSRVMVTNLIGTGIVARPRTKNKALKAKLSNLWELWCEVADADGVMDFAGLQTLVVRTWFQAGECFARIRPRRLYDGLPAPVQIQILEPDMVPLLDADAYAGLPIGNKIRQGVEFDKVGRRVAYWFHKEHPGDSIGGFVSADLVRITADQVIHVFNPLRPGQVRGVPESAPILAKLRTVMNFDDAVLTRQQIANLFTMFIERPMPTGAEAGIDPLTGKTVTYDSSGAPMAALEPGISQELLPGEKATFSDPPDAGANYGEFMRQQNLGIAAGPGIPYELMTGDIKDVSDRTLRVVINEFRRYCEQLQWTILIPRFCKPVRMAWANASVLAGSLTDDEAIEARLTDWAPHGWAYIHPVQDVQAKTKEVDAGFRSRSSVIAERGDDPEAVDNERAEDQERAIELRLAFEPIDPNEPPEAPEPTPQEKAEAEKTQAEALLFTAKARRELDEGGAALRRANSEAARNDAEAKRAQSQADLAAAEKTLAEQKAMQHEARAVFERRLSDLRAATDSKESEERIRLLRDQADEAKAETQARIIALNAAEAHAADMRALAKEAEANKVAVSRLELEAAQVGLNELKGN